MINQITSDLYLQKYKNCISKKIKDGFVIKENNEKLPYVVLNKTAKVVNHNRNLLFFFLSFGLWSIPWLYITFVSSLEKNIIIALDEDGELYIENCLTN